MFNGKLVTPLIVPSGHIDPVPINTMLGVTSVQQVDTPIYYELEKINCSSKSEFYQLIKTYKLFHEMVCLDVITSVLDIRFNLLDELLKYMGLEIKPKITECQLDFSMTDTIRSSRLYVLPIEVTARLNKALDTFYLYPSTYDDVWTPYIQESFWTVHNSGQDKTHRLIKFILPRGITQLLYLDSSIFPMAIKYRNTTVNDNHYVETSKSLLKTLKEN